MKNLLDSVRSYLSLPKGANLKIVLSEYSPSALCEMTSFLSEEEIVPFFLLLSTDQQQELITLLPADIQEALIQNLSKQAQKNLLAEMDPDDLVNLIQSLSPEIRRTIWENMSDEARKESLFLLRFDEDDAAGLMTPRYAAVRGEISVSQALSFVRREVDKLETVYYIYVVDQFKRLQGVISLRDLLRAEDQMKVKNIMEKRVISVREDTDQEETARVLEEFGLIALPVVDDHHTLLGIVTFDDIIEVIRDEQTEDVYKMGAMGGSTESYLSSSLAQLVLKRLPWLVVLLLTGTLTSNVISFFQPLVLGYTFLTLFIPIITQTGGNSGTQSATLMIRGMATGEIQFRDVGRVLLRELAVGILIGLAVGLIIWLKNFFIPPEISLLEGGIVALSLGITVLFATIFGALVPLFISKIGFDPAVAAGPLMSTIIDVCGLTIFFQTTRLLLQV